MIPKVRELLRSVRAEGRSSLLEHEVYSILSLAGLDVPRHIFWRGSPSAGMPEEVLAFLAGLPSEETVLKIASPDLLHKSDVGGLAFCPRAPEEVARRAAELWTEVGRRAPEASRDGMLLLEKLAVARGTPANETLVSLKQDAAFGPVVVLGLGGILTEWIGELSAGHSTVILKPGRVRETLERAAATEPAFSFLFRPSRLHAEAPLDLGRVAGALEALALLAAELGPRAQAALPSAERTTLEELEVNPMLLTTEGRWVAADGKGRFSDAAVVERTRPLRKIERLLRPRSAVVVGASATAVNPGRIILRNLKVSEGVTYGRLWAVHGKERTIDGIPCVRAVSELPETVDLAVVAIPAEGARDTIRALCASGKAESIILIPGGFAETGRTGLEEEIIDALTASRKTPGEGPVLVGGNCLGIVSKHQYNTFFLPQYKLPFHDAPGDCLVAVSQSGAYLVSLTSNLDGIIFPRASISFGNQMDLTVSDFLEFLLDDETVKVIACYVEGFKPLDGERFVALARQLRERGKRVVAFKAGKTALGAKAAQSHTASLAGDYAVARALMLEAGVIVAESLDMFEDWVKAFTMLFDRLPAGDRLAVLSNAGFECSAVLDRSFGLVPATLSGETRRRLTSCLPDIAHADNPVDATPMATTAMFVEAAAAMLDDPGVDALLISPIPVTPALDNLAPDLAGTHGENIYAPGSLPQELIRLFRATRKPVAVSVDSGRLYDDFVMVLQRAGIPVYRKIDRASRALAALWTQ